MVNWCYNAVASLYDVFATSLTAGPDSEKSRHPQKFAGKNITSLPRELVIKILINLDISDVSVCRRVNRRWRAIVDGNHLQAISFSRCHYHQPVPQTVEYYREFTRGWLVEFSDQGRELAEKLDELVKHINFSEILFFSVAELLANTKLLTCQEVCTVHHHHNHWVENASFSPDGCRLATASDDKTVRICELIGGQWEEKVMISLVLERASSSLGKWMAV